MNLSEIKRHDDLHELVDNRDTKMSVDMSQVYDLMKTSVTVLDIRTEEEFKNLAMAEAINIPFYSTGEFRLKFHTKFPDKHELRLLIIAESKEKVVKAIRALAVYSPFEEMTIYVLRGGMLGLSTK